MSNERQIKQQIFIQTTPKLAFEAVTEARELREWFCDYAQSQVRPGGRYDVRWNQGYEALGKFIELQAPQRAVFSWLGTDEPAHTTVEFTIAPQDDGVQVSLLHSGFGAGKDWDQALAAAEKGWASGLENLKSTLETGIDLRLARQPFLGIHRDQLNAERAAKEGIAVNEGIYVLSAVAGNGAEAAGLGKGDVITSLGGQPTPGFQELSSALRVQQAGDVVDVELMRGQERQTVQVTLGQRPQPEIPENLAALADVLEKAYAEANVALQAAVADVTEKEASQPPAEGEWSVKRVLAHLLNDERGFQFYLLHFAVNGWLDADEIPQAVHEATLDAILDVTPSTQALLEQFQTACAETIATLRRLPKNTENYKARYRRVVELMTIAPNHAQDHVEQIQAAILAVRGS